MPRVEPESLRARVDNRIASELDRRLVDRLVAGGGRSRRTARAGSFLMATGVHVAAIAVVAVGLSIVVLGDNWVQRVLGGVLLLPGVVLVLPRRSDETLDQVVPEAAPQFTALLRELTAALGTPPPTYVAIDSDINASAERRGLRQRRLVIGAPLWAALSPQGRIALLGHELGHFSNRDVVHGRYVWWAMRTLFLWIDMVTPHGLVSTEGRVPIFATIMTGPIRLPLVGYLELMWKVNAGASRHDELRADSAAAALAGTPGTIECLETLLLIDTIDVAANRAAVNAQRPDLAAEIRSQVDNVSEAARRALPTTGDESSVDRSHPRTVDRLRLQETVAPAAPLVVLDEARWAAIDAELKPLLDKAFKRMADGYRYVW
jgi:Zn-dependent protease with chaperone function